MSNRTITKRAFASVFAAMLACACALAFATPQKAHAGEFTTASLSAQEAAGNTTMYYAQELKSGKGVIGTFDSKDGSNTNLYEY